MLWTQKDMLEKGWTIFGNKMVVDKIKSREEIKEICKQLREDGKVIVKGADTISNRVVEIEADLVVLATAVLPRLQNQVLAG